MPLSAYLIACPLVFLAGFIDSIAGGGGLVSLPAYLIAGLPMHIAIGTNKISSTMGQLTACYRFFRGKLIDIPLVIPCFIASLAGSAIGSSLTALVDEQILRILLLVMLPVTAFYVYRRKNLEPSGAPVSRRRQFVLATVISLIIGAYDGFFGPGTGTFLILLWTGLAKISLLTASGNAKFVNLASNIAALTVFLLKGQTVIILGLSAGVFSIAGSYLGSSLAIKKGSKVIRVMILAVLGLLFVRLALEFGALIKTG